MKIKKDKSYRVKSSEFFKNKYGIENPLIVIEGRDKVIFGDVWKKRTYVPAVLAFVMRQIQDNLHSKEDENVYYGKIKFQGILLGELVFESELEKIS